MSHVTRLRWVAAGTLVLGLLSTARPAPAQSLMYGRTEVSAPERTDAGEWTGTWYYASRIRKMALWIREERGEVQIRLRLLGQAGSRESFVTDWNGRSEYVYAAKPASFALEIDESDENTVTGRWVWDLGTEELGRSETANVTIYRAGHGRQMVWAFKNFRHDYRGSDAQATELENVIWTFHKASRHQALWEELPF